ncbi:ABC transporter permease [Hypericibacter sp.]|uniref:ABC transporter permease n=1 Tax=Hypericibacter sp. TaxID=2705401 RepID=UPI003D6D15EE
MSLAEAYRASQHWPVTLRAGAVILIIHLVLAIAGPFIAPFDYAAIGTGKPLAGMSWAHPFNTDQIGRDVFSRTLYGGHIVLLLSISGTAVGLVVGCIIGLFSGLTGGWVDSLLMRGCEVLISIPFLVLALIAIMVAGPAWAGSPILLILAVGLVYVPRIARMARVAAVEVSSRDYVMAARLRGESSWAIIRHEILPNSVGTLLVEFAIRAGYAPVLIGALGFLGFGIRPPTPEWGLMMSEYRNLIAIAPMTMFGPGLMLASLVVGLNLFTEGLARLIGGKRVGDA